MTNLETTAPASKTLKAPSYRLTQRFTLVSTDSGSHDHFTIGMSNDCNVGSYTCPDLDDSIAAMYPYLTSKRRWEIQEINLRQDTLEVVIGYTLTPQETLELPELSGTITASDLLEAYARHYRYHPLDVSATVTALKVVAFSRSGKDYVYQREFDRLRFEDTTERECLELSLTKFIELFIDRPAQPLLLRRGHQMEFTWSQFGLERYDPPTTSKPLVTSSDPSIVSIETHGGGGYIIATEPFKAGRASITVRYEDHERSLPIEVVA